MEERTIYSNQVFSNISHWLLASQKGNFKITTVHHGTADGICHAATQFAMSGL